MAMNYAINAADVVQLGFVALENFLKNKPIDQVAVQHPLLKASMHVQNAGYGILKLAQGRQQLEVNI